MIHESQPDQYEVFISYSPDDKPWVENWLLPRLEQAHFKVGVSDTIFIIGAPKIENIERAFKISRRVIVVLTPAWLSNELSDFETSLLRFSDPAARRRKLLPLLLKPCDLPEAITALKLEPADFTVEKNWPREYKRLQRDIEDASPVSFPLSQGETGNLNQWRRWLRQRRRPVIRGLFILFAVWLVGSILFQAPPFQPRPGWRSLGLKVNNLYRLAWAGDVLLASTRTDFEGCDPANTGDTGLWRSLDRGENWQYVVVPALKVSRPGQECVIAAITSFASDPMDPRRVYASSSDAGLLLSEDAGEHWQRVSDETIPDKQLHTVEVAPGAPPMVWVAAERGGIFRWSEDEESWRRIDGEETCDSTLGGETSLPAGLRVGVIRSGAEGLVIATDDNQEQPGPSSGIYASQDGGDCWVKIHDAQERYSYKDIAEIPEKPSQLLVLSRDYNVVSDRPNRQLWILEENEQKMPVLWETSHVADRLFFDNRSQTKWYSITDLGEVFRGDLAGGGSEQLPGLSKCRIPPTCRTDLAEDHEPGAPLVLAEDRVYRMEKVPWWKALWP